MEVKKYASCNNTKKTMETQNIVTVLSSKSIDFTDSLYSIFNLDIHSSIEEFEYYILSSILDVDIIKQQESLYFPFEIEVKYFKDYPVSEKPYLWLKEYSQVHNSVKLSMNIDSEELATILKLDEYFISKINRLKLSFLDDLSSIDMPIEQKIELFVKSLEN